MKTSTHWMVALAAALAAVGPGEAPAAGTKYEVNISAESGSGTVFKTVAGGLLRLKVAGDELTIQRGQYTGSVELRGAKGAANSPIIIRGIREPVPAAEASQPNAWMAHATIIKADKDHALMLKDCSYVQIDSLVFTAAKEHGVYLENCDHITVRDCDAVGNIRCQIKAQGGDHITLDGCELSGSILEHGCHFVASNQPIVRNCLIHHNCVAGIYMTGDKTISGDGLIDKPLIECNVLYANGRLKDGAQLPRDEKGKEIHPVSLREGSAAICGDGVEYARICNNLIYRNSVGGIVLYRQFAARAGQHDRVLHNTIYLADSGGAFGVNLALSTQDTSVYNNLIVTAQGPAIFLGPNASRDLHSDFNVLFRLDNKDALRREKEDLPLTRWQELYKIDMNSVVFKPPFVDPDNTDLAKCDFQLKPESSLGGKCRFNWESQTDCLGLWRPRDKVTPGCYELNPTAGNPNEQPPNPAARRPKHGPGDSTPPPPPPSNPPKPKDPTDVLPPL